MTHTTPNFQYPTPKSVRGLWGLEIGGWELPSAMRTRGIAFVRARPGTGQLVAARSGVPRDMKARVVVDPVDQAVLEHRIGARHALRNRERVADLSRRERVRNVD